MNRRPGTLRLCRALSAILRRQLTIRDAIVTHRVPRRQVSELRERVRAGRMPW